MLPLFGDQYDNAQRLEETGFGRRLDTDRVGAHELRQTIEVLLGDAALRARSEAVGEQVRGEDGVRRAAALVAYLGSRSGSSR